MSANLKAFRDMLAYSELGSKLLAASDNGYNVLYGGGLFAGYATHPNQRIKAGGITSTAAGRYQILHWVFVSYAELLKLPDFSPASQDAICNQLIKERNALTDIENGNIVSAIGKCSNIWASLPGNNYKQHQQKLDDLLAAYKNAGGNLA